MVKFKTLERKRLSDEIAEQIKQHVINKSLIPGEKLASERELALQFGVSRPVIRESLKILEYVGFLEVIPGATGGSVVRKANSQLVSGSLEVMFQLGTLEIKELLEARLILEKETAHFAAIRATSEDLIRIEHSISEMKKSINDPDVKKKFIEANDSFHTAVAKAAKNQILLLNVSSLRQAVFNLIEGHNPGYESINSALSYHQEIFEAIKARDGKAARRAMEEHMMSFERRIND